jgi:hypothetical protein
LGALAIRLSQIRDHQQLNLITVCKGILIEMKDIKVNWARFTTQVQGVGRKGHKGKLVIGVLPKSKLSMLIGQKLTSPITTLRAVVDVVGLATIHTLMICKECSHLQRMFDTHVENVVVIKEDLNDMHEEKDELFVNIELQESQVAICKSKLQDATSQPSNIKEEFDKVDSAFKGVLNKVKTCHKI